MRIYHLVLVALLSQGLPAWSAQVVELPLLIPPEYLEQSAAQALELDADGQTTLASDACNRLDLGNLTLVATQDLLEVEMSLRAHSGAFAFGRCAGPRPLQGRVRLHLVPQIVNDGLTVRFTPRSLEVLGDDGRTGLLTGASRLLADHLILPRLDNMEIELATSLAQLDDVLESFLPRASEKPPRLAQRARVSQLTVAPQGLALSLQFAIRPTEPGTPEPVLDAEELQQWQRLEDELDGFLTVILTDLARRTEQRELALGLMEVLIDARWRIAEALASDNDGTDPIRGLFLDSWRQLQPLLAALDIDTSIDLRVASFIAAGDALLALDALGPEFGLEVSRDGLRRLARLLLDERAPLQFTPLPLNVDPELRRLFGFEEDMRLDSVAAQRSGNAWSWLLPQAHASSPSPGEALRGLVPRLAILDDYLALVNQLLDFKVNARVDHGSRVPEDYLDLFDPLVRATAWKESCWRHYVGPVDSPRVIRSSAGAIGMMQIMGRVWRGIYDLERLEAEVEYNVAAGIEILEHYLIDYALRRGEHEQPGGRDNLVRAAYAAYNGGPSHLSRYRREDTPARLRAIDQAFWRDFEQMRSEQWPDVAGCY